MDGHIGDIVDNGSVSIAAFVEILAKDIDIVSLGGLIPMDNPVDEKNVAVTRCAMLGADYDDSVGPFIENSIKMAKQLGWKFLYKIKKNKSLRRYYISGC